MRACCAGANRVGGTLNAVSAGCHAALRSRRSSPLARSRFRGSNPLVPTALDGRRSERDRNDCIASLLARFLFWARPRIPIERVTGNKMPIAGTPASGSVAQGRGVER
jgi:hypothetical protein